MFLFLKSYFAVSKNIRLDSTHYFIMKIRNKPDLKQITYNHLSDIDFRGFMNFYKNVFFSIKIEYNLHTNK